MARLLIVVILLSGFWLTGCSEKDKKDEIQALGQGAAKDQAAAVIDSLDRVAAQRAGKEPLDRQPAVAVPDSGENEETVSSELMPAEATATEAAAENQAETVPSSSMDAGGETATGSAESDNPVSEVPTQSSDRPTSGTAESEPRVSPTEVIAAGAGGFVVQVGSYNSEKLAQKMLQKYRSGQYPIFVHVAEVNSRTVYQLRIGGYQTRDEAKAIGEKFKNEFSVAYWVTAND